METKKRAGHDCSLLCHCDKSMGGFFAKIFLGLVCVAFVLVLSMVIFMKIGRDGQWGRRGMYGFSSSSSVPCPMMNQFFDKSDRSRKSEIASTRLFGTIEKIEGNLITVKDNAAQSQVVVSLANTVIVSEGGEVGLSALRVGANIVTAGAMNAEKQLVAKIINIVK